MKKAFTLIELLVVIAIIAILAAILFPVFAQAKLAAKKTVAISNQKQIGLSILMYSNDYDDVYPRQDACTLNDALNPAFDNLPAGTDPTPYCSGAANPGGFAFRDNHYSWQKWVMPYVKSAPIFLDPVQTYDAYSWGTFGEVEGGYQLNIAITGALNTWNNPNWATTANALRNSWTGGTTTSISSPAEAFIMMEGPFDAVVPAMNVYGTPASTAYPFAIREHWTGWFYNTSPAGSGACSSNGTLDNTMSPFSGQVPLSYCDGHTKTIPVGQFLANTPTAADYGTSVGTACFGYAGPNDNVVANIHITSAPTWTQPWPMWGLQ